MLEKKILTNGKQIEFDLTSLPRIVKKEFFWKLKTSENYELSKALRNVKTIEDLNFENLNFNCKQEIMQLLTQVADNRRKDFKISKRDFKIISLKNKLIISIIMSD